MVIYCVGSHLGMRWFQDPDAAVSQHKLLGGSATLSKVTIKEADKDKVILALLRGDEIPWKKEDFKP